MILSPLPIGIPIPGGSIIKKVVDGALVNVGPDPTVEVTVQNIQADGVLITSALDVSDAIGQDILVLTDSQIDGDSIRGHYAKIKLGVTSSSKYELYAVNAHITASHLHHP